MLILALLLVISANRVIAQIPISYGQCVEGSIARGETDIYTFSGVANEIVVLRLATDWRYYAQLELYCGGNRILLRNGEYGLRVDTLRLPSTCTYSIWVLDDNGFETGTYTLCIQRVVNPVGARAFTYGQTLNDTVSQRSQIRAFTFTASDNEVLTARIACSWRYYPQMELYNPLGRRISLAAGEYGIRIDTIRLNAGIYSLFILDDNGHETGNYTLHLQKTVNPTGGRSITYGQTVHDTVFQRSQIRPFTFTAAENDIVTLRLSCEWRYYPQVELYNSAGRRIRLLNGEYGLRLDTLRLQAGTYSLFILDDNGHEFGRYAVHLQRTFNPGSPMPIGENITMRDTLRSWAHIKAYTFNGTQGTRITIRLQTDWRYYAQFELYDPNGRRVVRASGEYSVRADTCLYLNGLYTILVMDDNGFEGGGYTITKTTIGVCVTSAGSSASGTFDAPSRFALSQNYPNPFNPETKIKFSIGIPSGQIPRQTDGGQANSSEVTLKVFDLLGREVATLVNERLQPGSYETTFDGSGLASGVYLYRLKAGGFVETKKLLLLR
jgi:DUF971 family protein